MIDPLVQQEHEYENREAESVARDEKIDRATDDSILEIDVVDLMDALTEIDISKVGQENYAQDSVENDFHNLMLAVRLKGETMDKMVAQSVRNIVWKNHRIVIEQGWED